MKRTLLLSLVLNVLLMGVAAGFIVRARSAAPPSATALASVPVANRVTVTARPAAVSYLTNQFHWRQLESDDYVLYLSNLRGVGCPEKTVRDIILADVRAHYESLRAGLSHQSPFWLAGRKRREQVQANAAELRRIRQEEGELIGQLLGWEWPGDEAYLPEMNLAEQAVMRFVIGPVPDESIQQILSTFARFEQLDRDLRDGVQGILTAEDELEMKRLRQQQDTEVRRVLTADQFDEMIARGVAVDFFDSLHGLDLSEAEARRIALARAGASGSQFLWDGPDFETPEEKALREARFTNDVAGILGGPRFEEYQRAQDDTFRQLFYLTREHQMPKQIAVQVYDMQRLAAEEVGRIQQDNSLNAAARNERFREIETGVQRRASEVLGPVYQEYLQGHGSWLTNVTAL